MSVVEIISLVFTVISLAAGYIYYYKSRQYRELTWESSTSPLLTVGEDLRTKVRIIYKEDDTEVQDIQGVRIKIVSSGTLGAEVSASSVTESPVTVDFGEGAKIVGTTVKKIEPVDDDLQETVLDEAATIVDSRKIVLNPILLNPGAALSIWTFISNFQLRQPKVTANIKDLRIRREAPPEVADQPTKAVPGQILHEPILLTFPIAYATALIISQVLGGAAWADLISALFVSLLIYSLDWYTASSAWRYPEDYLARLIYVVFNTSIIVLLLGGALTLGEAR